MRVFVAGGTGAVGRYLIPALIADGHQVTASTRSAGKSAELAAAGVVPVVMDGLDRDAVLAAVRDAAPEVIVHQMTSVSATKDFRRFDEEFAVTNELRTRGTDYLLEAARLAGVRRFIAQSFTGFTNEYAGTLVKTEDDPLNPDPPVSARQTLAAIRHVDETVPDRVPEGIVLRYGLFYGHGASNGTLSAVRAGKFPVIGGGTGIWSCWNPCRRRSGPCSGRDRVARFLAGLIRRIRNLEASFRIVEANGPPGAVTYDRDGHVANV